LLSLALTKEFAQFAAVQGVATLPDMAVLMANAFLPFEPGWGAGNLARDGKP
jgi:hypothetical protein